MDSGDPAKADKVLPPFNKLGEPIANTIGPVDYVALQRMWDDTDPRQGGEYIKSGFVTDVDGADSTSHVDYIRSYWSTIEKFTDGFYTNTGDFETQESLNRNYRSNHQRLVALKDKYDPGNLFRLNADVQPSG